MTMQNRSLKEILNRSFLRSKAAPLPSVDAEWERLTDRHRDGDAGAFDAFESSERQPGASPYVKARKPMWVAAAAMIIAGISLSIVFRPLDAAAKVASSEGVLQRVSDGVAEGLNLDDPVRLGETIRSKGEVGG